MTCTMLISLLNLCGEVMIMSKSILTLIGLYEYDNSIFDDVYFPAGIDKDVLINNILLEAGEFSVLYPNPDFMKKQMAYWSQKNYRTFERWINALSIDYEPLYNYDRTEIWSDKGLDSRETTNQIDTTTESDITTSDDTLNKISAYDSSTLQDDTKSERDVTSNDTTTSGTSATGSDGGTFESSHEGRMYGNIGVTTTQQMLEQELKIAKWNIYENITDLFLNEFCIMVY